MNLDKYIEDLLYRYECVVIPNFGAFITSVNSAKPNEDGVFMPPSKSILRVQISMISKRSI